MKFGELPVGAFFTFIKPKFFWQRAWFIKVEATTQFNAVALTGETSGQFYVFLNDEAVRHLCGGLQLVQAA